MRRISLKRQCPSEEWPFDAPKNLAVITTKSIMYGGKPILIVSHNEEDDGWQFLDGDIPRVEEALVVGLDCITQKDPSVLELADLPSGWQAWRENANSSWKHGVHS